MEYKFRNTSVLQQGAEYLTFDQGATRPYGDNDRSATLTGHQEILTENHPGWNTTNGWEGDQGGPFHSRKTEIVQEGPSSKGSIGTSYYGYDGQLGLFGLDHGGGTTFESFPAHASVDSVDRLFALGGTAVSRTLPTNPVGGAAVFLGELRQGAPSIIGSSFRSRAHGALKAQKAGGEYLNVEFGWKPLIADLRKFATGVKKHDQIVSQLSRDSGRNVRRRYAFPIEEESQNYDLPNRQFVLGGPDGGALNTYLYAAPGTLTNDIYKSTVTYFSGCYTYHLPDYNQMFGVSRYVAEADKVLGVRFWTPEVLWNLAPWSWAADWVANTGDVMTNLTAFSQNDFAMRYGYLMQKRQEIQRYAGTQALHTWRNGPQAFTASRTYRAIAMSRVPASPFGFGFNWDGFSPRQLAITAALGISRVR